MSFPVRICSLVLLFAALTSSSPAAEQYRICFMNTAGQVSVPDDPGNKSYFIDLAKVGGEPAQYFGGPPKNGRFKVVKYDEINKILTCEEVATRKTFDLEVGKWVNFLELTL